MMTLNRRDQFALVAAAVAAAFIIVLPQWLDLFTLLSLTVYLVMALLALSLAFIWGFGGILCFGQAAFFGLGAYAYAVGALNIADSTVAVVLAILVPTLFAAALGYFMFYGGISDVYVGVITLAVTLILFNLLNASAGGEYRIGEAALGGFNGIPAIPTLNVPFMPERVLSPEALFIVSGLCLVAVYVALRLTLGSRFGRTVIAIRENEQRAALLGYDVRLHKLLVFSLGGGVAGLAGCLYANWGAFISPEVFGLAQSAQIIIWVIVGGRGTLLGPILACIALQWLVNRLGTQSLIDSGLVLGALLMAVVMLLPKGLLPTLLTLCDRRRGERDIAPSKESAS